MPMVISKDQQFEISPTMPMVPNKDEPPENTAAAPMATEELFGTSPTLQPEASNTGTREPLASIENSNVPHPSNQVRPENDDLGRSLLKESVSGKQLQRSASAL